MMNGMGSICIMNMYYDEWNVQYIYYDEWNVQYDEWNVQYVYYDVMECAVCVL